MSDYDKILEQKKKEERKKELKEAAVGTIMIPVAMVGMFILGIIIVGSTIPFSIKKNTVKSLPYNSCFTFNNSMSTIALKKYSIVNIQHIIYKFLELLIGLFSAKK